MKGLKSSVDKTFAILEHFTVENGEWSITELAKELDSNKSTVYRFLSDMKKRGIMYQNPDSGKYGLGLKLFELGNRVQIKSAFIDKTNPELVKVAQNITETVHIGVIKNKQVYYIDKVESPLGLKISTTIGTYKPLHATGLGKILMAYSHQNYEELISHKILEEELTSYTINTITNHQKLFKELRKIKKQGYALDNEELELGLICLAVPIFNQRNEVVASLSVDGPSSRFKIKKLEGYLKIMNAGATEIQKKIGDIELKLS